MTDNPTPAWIEIAVEVAGIDAELAADLLRQGCTGGVAIEAPSRLDLSTDAYILDGDASALVKGYLPATEDSDRVQRSMRLALQTAPLQRQPVWHDPQQLQEEDWRDSWKKYFGIQRMGKAIVIVPSWIEYTPKSGETIIRIDPGMAFGTGQHQTTAMCLAAVEEFAPGARSVLDLGCGSGILAIAAAKVGAARMVAMDIDPLAVKAATENVESNGVASVVEVREGSLEPATAPTETFDLIVANISGLTLQRLATAIAESLTPGGRLVASGFLEDRVDELKATFAAAGLRIERAVHDGMWRTIIARRS